MHEAFTSLLLSDGALVAEVEDRIVWKRGEPTAQLPRLVLHNISSNRDYTLSGPSGLVESRVQVDCLGLTYLSALQTARKVETLLSGYHGVVATTKFDGIFLQDERDVIEDEDSPSDLFGVSLDFIVWHKEN